MTLDLALTFLNFQILHCFRFFFWRNLVQKIQTLVSTKCVPLALLNNSPLSFIVLALTCVITNLQNIGFLDRQLNSIIFQVFHDPYELCSISQSQWGKNDNIPNLHYCESGLFLRLFTIQFDKIELPVLWCHLVASLNPWTKILQARSSPVWHTPSKRSHIVNRYAAGFCLPLVIMMDPQITA